MELTPKQQIVELVNQSNKILLLTHINPDGDALGSILSLYLILKKIGKKVTAVCQDSLPGILKFLPAISEVKQNLEAKKDFVITLDTSKTEVDKLGYKHIPEENKLNIIITPASGTFLADDVSISYGGLQTDLVFVLDSPDLERLGPAYDENTDLFYETPIVNIDHHPGNDYFGKVNWVDLTATSTAEILVSLIESLGRDKNLFDSDIATCLLTGLTTDTGSFQHNNTTPKSFTIAAQLVAAGARQQEIVQHVYKTKPLSTLKIWGKILSNIVEEKNYHFVWSFVRTQDFRSDNADESEVSGIIDELLKTAPKIDFALLLSERKNGVHGSLRGVEKGINVAEVAALFNGGGHELAAAFHLPDQTLVQSQEEIIAKIRHYQAERLNLVQKTSVSNDSSEIITPIEETETQKKNNY